MNDLRFRIVGEIATATGDRGEFFTNDRNYKTADEIRVTRDGRSNQQCAIPRGTACAPRILLRVPNWLGDNVLAAPAVVALRMALPGAHLAVLVREAMADFWRMLPIDEIITFPAARGVRGLQLRWQTAQAVRRGQFDAAVILPNSFDSALIPWLARIPRRAGWVTDARGLLINQRVPFPRHLNEQSQSQRYIYLLEQFLGSPLAAPLDVRLAIPADARAKIAAACSGWQPLVIGLNPGATYGTAKCWLPERFAAIACRAHAGLGAHVIIVGGPGDRPRCELVMTLITQAAPDAPAWCVNLAGATTICELAAWLERCACVVTNDTGAMHVAAAVGTPVAAIFGPTDWRTTAPLGTGHRLIRSPVPCAPCLRRDCSIDHRCMTSVTTDEVWQAVLTLTSQNHPGAA